MNKKVWLTAVLAGIMVWTVGAAAVYAENTAAAPQKPKAATCKKKSNCGEKHEKKEKEAPKSKCGCKQKSE